MSFFGSLFRGLFGGKKKDKVTDYRLDQWKEEECRDIKRPRDARTKFCMANIGKAITIKYKGKPRTITPVKVFTKPKYRKTYVLAMDNGERKHFDISDITLIRGKRKK